MIPKELEEAGRLKGRLVKFGQSKRFASALKRELKKQFGDPVVAEEGEIINFMDWFLLEKRFPDGETVADKFVRYIPSLTKEEKETVLRWKDVTYGFFEVRRLIDHGFIVWNHINDVEYVVKPNVESGSLGFKRGDYFVGRIVPLKGYHTISGNVGKIEGKKFTKQELVEMVAKLQTRFPGAAFKDNLQKVQKGRELVREYHQAFLDYFGADEVVVRGEQLRQTMEEFYKYYILERPRKKDGKTIAGAVKEKKGLPPRLPKMNFPPELVAEEDVGILFDPVEGLFYLINYGRFREIFSSEGFKEIEGYRECVMGYLEDDSISTLPFKRAKSRSPIIAQKVLRDVLENETFSIVEDFDDLMREYKSDWTDKERLPSFIPLGGVNARP